MAKSNSAKKIFAAKLSISTAVSLAAVKFFVGIASGSMAVISSAIDSMLDILMSGFNYLAIKVAEQPADEDHAYGHGKFETLAAMIQALIIGGSGVWITLESISRIIQKQAPHKLGSGIIVLVISVIASFLLSRYLVKVAKETDSPALKADSLHFSMDVYTNLALCAGLVVMHFFNIGWLDGLLSLLVGIYILSEAIKLVKKAADDILDKQIPEEERNIIENIIETEGGGCWDCHDLRTRKAGSHRIIDFHLTVCKGMTVEFSHSITEMLEEKINSQLPHSDITIHIEPCEHTDCPSKTTKTVHQMIEELGVGRRDCPKN